MERILFLAHTKPDGTLPKAALEAFPSALALAQGGELQIGLIGGLTQPAAGQLASCGASRFLAVEGEPFQHSRYATDVAAIEAVCRKSGAAIVIAPHTSRWARAIPEPPPVWTGV